MVLAELGQKITAALHNLNRKTIVGEEEIKQVLNDIARALLAADVNIALVKKLQNSVKTEVALVEGASGMNLRKIVQQAVYNGIVRMLDPGVKAFLPEKTKSSVVMFVGLQGGGKTTSCTKYALFFQKRGLKTALVCADTFRAGAYDQLKQNAFKAKIRFYGSITESDPVVIAREGVAELKREKYQLIIVDTSGRHRQEEALFEEMKQVEEAIKPNDIVYVMDATNGQAIHEQAMEFKKRVKVGSCIITKLDCQAKGGGALSAVAATQSPIVFVGTGEHFDEFEVFNAQSFSRKMLGLGDIGGLVETIKDANIDPNSETFKRMQDGVFTLRDMYEHLMNIQKIGPVGKIIEMLPGMAHLAGALNQGGNDAGTKVLQNFIHIMNSMTSAELDDGKVKKMMTNSRMLRIAKGSGRSIFEVQQLIVTFTKFEEVVKKVGKMNFKAMSDPSQLSGRGAQQQMAQLSKALTPQMLRQLGGAAGLQQMMRQMSGMPGMGGALGGLGGLGA